ncbi:ZINC KNUCKLE (CCHC-TYPE) FAMILY PROTEIN [Salix koriyanagi]|uniref:ZINC KNUCKLE (CCHC-TYPE) FAMILY PROTEIN n=1 Tax=Salix koriyanagi TaxID=2511006 RepID=A0A9Q0WQP8_9ROSI|nr:ZINC KNUCKLE (CCHC-TYPE) FAMILY PROTEIN [Salix koriyanagi]
MGTRLMNSHTPPSQLHGFFLRLRLGKWEQGPGGSGYGVACITGAENESSTRKSKNSIAVNVGGVKCLVESQYISNHDFTKDELMAWWWATLKGGGNIPSEEDLRLKVKEMKMLGV